MRWSARACFDPALCSVLKLDRITLALKVQEQNVSLWSKESSEWRSWTHVTAWASVALMG